MAKRKTNKSTLERSTAVNLGFETQLPKDYARRALDRTRLGQLIELVFNIRVDDKESRSKDILGRVYEYFLSQFASAEGKKGGKFYTPRCIVRLLVEMLEPYQGRVYNPYCGSGGMFVHSVEFIRAHATSNGNSGKARSDHFLELKADYILANPPFNVSDWGGGHLREDKRWKFGSLSRESLQPLWRKV